MKIKLACVAVLFVFAVWQYQHTQKKKNVKKVENLSCSVNDDKIIKRIVKPITKSGDDSASFLFLIGDPNELWKAQ